MYDGIFIINNALRVTQLSVFTETQRFEQTLETIASIDKYCPNNKKYMFDSSPLQPEKSYVDKIAERGVTVFYMGQEPNVKSLSEHGMRSFSETITFLTFIHWFKQNLVEAKRIYKLSGRYHINDNFVLNDDRYKDAFVFAKPLDSWMKKEIQANTGASKLYNLRLWHMDFNLLDTFENELKGVLQECSNHGIDVEHAYYKQLHKYNVVEVDKIGVEGNIAPNGEYINE